MASRRSRQVLAFVLLLPIVVHVQGCGDSNPVETINVSLKNTELYQYSTVSGDEDGATISLQARHYSISEIRRNAETHWVAVYVYQPVAGFVGSDHVAIEVLTGSDGASPPTNIKKVAFHFDIND
jgi:hypothetical protein